MAARAVCALGLVCGALVWSVAGVAGTTVALIVLSWWLLLILGVNGRRRNRIARRAGAGIAGAAGLVAAAGVAGIVLLLLLVVSSPFLRFLVRSRRRPTFEDDPQATPAPPASGGRTVRGHVESETSPSGRLAELTKRLPRRERLVDLDDSALCLAWRQSFVSLAATRDARLRLELAELREQYLDELTRRHPVEISRWLASGARAASNPMRFLSD